MADSLNSSEAQNDIRPVVAKVSGTRAPLFFGAILLALAGGIFYALQMRRMELTSPSLVTAPPDGGGTISSPPELVIPPAPEFEGTMPGYGGSAASGPNPMAGTTNAYLPRPVPQSQTYTSTVYPSTPAQVTPSFAAPPINSGSMAGPRGPGVAFQSASLSAPPSGDGASAGNSKDNRILAGRLENPGMTVPQGSVIQAVMETALDSTRAGFARAIVSRDVMSFDGTRVLISKGSRLFGDYKADVSLGQKRALIQWQRLTRPDGTIIALDSPSADPLGRAGVRGKVNTHFFERFAGSILQSVLDIGVRAATSEATNSTVIIGTPTGVTQGALVQQQGEIKPTLKIRQGASIAVFVARDLDFSSVE